MASFFSDLLSTITERGRILADRGHTERGSLAHARELAEALLSETGEASGAALADSLLRAYAMLDGEHRVLFLHDLADRFGCDLEDLGRAMEAFRAEPSQSAAARVHQAAEPRRQELIRRLNSAPGGTAAIVAMRADLLAECKNHPGLAEVDGDFQHMFTSWFNRGFLVLRNIDWATPAVILEKIIRYEAVHEISSWQDLRRRIEPTDRRCFAFFHPALPDEPLIFVEVALTRDMPGEIAPILAEGRAPIRAEEASTAVFYSISNCQKGLRGVSFGNFLIKQVAHDLSRDLPQLKSFVTLSPAPGFARWLEQVMAKGTNDTLMLLTRGLARDGWPADAVLAGELKSILYPLAARYLLEAKRADGKPADPVERFHLGNGASLERINWLGDCSEKGLRESCGIMVNYLYRLKNIEKNHESYARQNKVTASSAARQLCRAAALIDDSADIL